MANFKKGDRVAVLNTSMGGTLFVEGKATIVGPAENGVEGQYEVDFGDGMIVERFIDPAAQADPALYVANLNAGDQPAA